MIKTIKGFCNVILLGLLLLDQFGAYGEEMVRSSKLFHRPVSCSTSRLIIIPRVDYSLLSRPTRKNVIEAGQLWKVQMSVLDQEVIMSMTLQYLSLTLKSQRNKRLLSGSSSLNLDQRTTLL